MTSAPADPGGECTDVDQHNDQRNNNHNNQRNWCEPEQRTRVTAEQAAHVQQSVPLHQTDLHQVHITVQNVLPPNVTAPRAGPDRVEGALAGQILAVAGGQPIAGAPVEIFFGPPTGLPVHRLRTDPSGRFIATDLPPGYYAVRVSLPGSREYRTAHNLQVRSGQVARHRFSIDRTRSPSGGPPPRTQPPPSRILNRTANAASRPLASMPLRD